METKTHQISCLMKKWTKPVDEFIEFLRSRGWANNSIVVLLAIDIKYMPYEKLAEGKLLLDKMASEKYTLHSMDHDLLKVNEANYSKSLGRTLKYESERDHSKKKTPAKIASKKENQILVMKSDFKMRKRKL